MSAFGGKAAVLADLSEGPGLAEGVEEVGRIRIFETIIQSPRRY